MGYAQNTAYSRHIQCLQDYIREVQDHVKNGMDLQDIGISTDMDGMEYACYLQSVERKHKQLWKTSDICEAVPLLSEVQFDHTELDMSIRNAEYLLGIPFCPEYRKLLYNLGGVRYRYGSISGIIPVIRRTLAFRQKYLFFSDSKECYVVDETEDGHLFLQKSSGAVFEVLPEGSMEYYCSSLIRLVKMREFGLITEQALFI